MFVAASERRCGALFEFRVSLQRKPLIQLAIKSDHLPSFHFSYVLLSHVIEDQPSGRTRKETPLIPAPVPRPLSH